MVLLQVFVLFDERGRKLEIPSSSSQTNSGDNNNNTISSTGINNQNKLNITLMSTGNVYHADSKGEITIPFSGTSKDHSEPVKETIAITYGAFSVLEQFPHYVCIYFYKNHKTFLTILFFSLLQKGHYLLKAGMFIDDEQLTPRAGIVGEGNWTKLVIRPRLFICGSIAPLSLLKNVVLSVATYL